MKKYAGFTLIELMITTTVLALVLFAAIPSFLSFLERKSLPEVAKLLEKSIQMARVEALSRGRTTTLEPLGADWNTGWQITWIDDDGAKDTLREFADPYDGADISYSTNDALTFEPNGQITNIGSFSLTQANDDAVTNCNYTLNILVSGVVQKRFSGC